MKLFKCKEEKQKRKTKKKLQQPGNINNNFLFK